MLPLPADLTCRTGLRASGAVVDITPERPLELAAAAVAEKRSTSIQDRLEANCVLLAGDDGTRILIVAVDLLYPGPLLRRELMRVTGLSDHELILLGSHTHNAPAMSPDLPLLGQVDGLYADRISGAIADAYFRISSEQGQTIASWSVGQADSNVAINRRRLKRGGTVTMAPNSDGPVDRTCSTLQALDPAGDPLFLLWNFACHPVSHPETLGVSAHFPGEVRRKVRRIADDTDFPVLFAQGFSGDCRPRTTRLPQRPVDLVRAVLRRQRFFRMNRHSYRRFVAQITDTVEKSRGSSTTRPATFMRVRRLALPLADFVDGEAARARTLAAHSWEVDGAVLVAVSAEAVGAYGKRLRELRPETAVFPAGCLDDTFGYAPLEEMMDEGGYEVVGFCSSFGLTRLLRDFPVKFWRLIESVTVNDERRTP